MILVRARSGGKHGLQAGGAAVLARKCIDLNAGFLDRVGLWGQIQDALANSTGHVEPIHHILIVILPLTVGARVHLLFGGEIVYARPRTTGRARPQSGDSWGQRHQHDQIPADDGQLGYRLILESQLSTAVRSVDYGSLGANIHRLRY